ncbi:TPA: restriction endonuclease subunit S, partial [Escherichia coli]|nr:restriction endonuclease subunit S [Escherichia coli]
YLYLESQSESLKKKSGGSAINNLLLGDLKKKLLSIPPLNEQQKIVDNVRLLESTLNIIKVKLQSAQQTQLHLADALTDAAIN